MAKQEFLENFRVARNLFLHNRFATQAQQASSKAPADKFARAAIWLTPKSVKGFDAADFAELGPDQQAELSAAVQEFSQSRARCRRRNRPPPGNSVQLRPLS